MAGLFGLILGFMFGVGCAAAVIYTVYMGGYRKALNDMLAGGVSERYLLNLRRVREKMDGGK
jgi:hypothetical protein